MAGARAGAFIKHLKSGTAAVVTPLSVDVTASHRSGNAPLTVLFTATSIGGVAIATKTFTWVYGDGTTGTGATPTKIYTTAGNYTATVTVTDGFTNDTASVAIVVGAPTQALTATFTATPTSGASPFTTRFVTTPSGGSGAYTVTIAFGDGTSGGGTSTTKTYSTVGSFTATATISDGTSSITRSVVVTVSQPVVTPLVAVLSPATASGTAPFSQAFAGTAAGGTPPYTWAYTFGDGGTSTLQNPTYSFQNAGTYTVTLTVRDGTRTSTDTTTVTVNAPSTDNGTTDFSSWKDKTIPPNNDWIKYGSLKGNPDFNESKLSTDLQTYWKKAIVYHRRLQLTKGSTTTIPGTTTTKGYIRSGRGYQYGQSGGEDRDWYTAMRTGRSGGLPNIRDWGRFAMPFTENAMHIFQLTHDLEFLDIALWWFEGYWDAMLTSSDATETWSGSGRSRTVSVTCNVNGQYGPHREWKSGVYNSTVDEDVASKWTAVKYWGDAGTPINALWHKNPTMTNVKRTKRLHIMMQDGSIAHDSNGGNSFGTVQVLEDGLLAGIWGRLLVASYLNRNTNSATRDANYYATMHAKLKCYIFDHWIPMWQTDYGVKTNFQKFNKHPFMYDELCHSYTNITRFYWHLYTYAGLLEADTIGTTKSTWTSRKSDYLDSFLMMGEALANDWTYYDLKDQVSVDKDIDDEDMYNEDCMPFGYSHYVGYGGYVTQSYDTSLPSWGKREGWPWGKNDKRRTNGSPKTIYFTQQVDTGMDMYLSRYWEDLPTAEQSRMKTRKGRDDASYDAYHWGQKYMNGITAMISYAISTDPSDGSRSKKFWNNTIGSARSKETNSKGETTQTAISANWIWANRHNLKLFGESGGDPESAYNLAQFLQYNVCIIALAFQSKLTGKYKSKFKDAYALEKSAQGGWSVGNTDNITESSLELLVHLMSGQA